MTRRLNVLLSAYACNPYRGSEEGVGWGWAQMIAKRHDVHVITAAYQREPIERWAAEHPGELDGISFHYVSHKWWHYSPTPGWTFIESSALKPIMNLAYGSWLKEAHRVAANLHSEHRFDLVHLVTYVGFRFPGRYWRMDLPLVWGPIGGLENTPWRFLPLFGVGGSIYYAGRNLINSLQKLWLRGPKRSFRKARGGIIAATEGMRREILRCYGEESEIVCEIGVSPAARPEPSTREPGQPLKIAWSGEHLPGKALPLLLRALAEIGTDVDWRLTILGKGACTEKWRSLALKAGVDDRCTWTGWVERADALERLSDSHVFVITSLKDLTSTVLLEALGQGVPVICPDHCGFANVVTADCGIKLPVESPQQLAGDIAQAIRKLAADERERRRLADGALRRSCAFDWESKGHQVDAVYARVAFDDSTAAAGSRSRGRPTSRVAT